MSKADQFFAKYNALDDDVNSAAIDKEIRTIEDVEYTTHTFEDGSKLTQGSNGYIGCETPVSNIKNTNK